MRIEIILKNKTQCNGCPCLHIDYEQNCACNLGYWEAEPENYNRLETIIYNRPQICIDNHGG